MSALPWIKVDAAMKRGLLRDASSCARNVADYAEEVLQAARRTGRAVTLNKAEMAKELGVGPRSIERAVKELVERSVLRPRSAARGCDTFDIAYARVGKNKAERDDERERKRKAEQRKAMQMQQATILEFKGKQAAAGGERRQVVAA